jgi:hypothetical protein
MRFWILASILLALCLAPSGVLADSDLAPCVLNGVNISSDVTVKYNGVGAGAADTNSASDSGLVIPTTPSDIATAAANLTPAGGGDDKDKVEGFLTAAFEFGTPFGSTAFDTLRLDAFGSASAVDAKNSAGNPAGAEVTGWARTDFFIEGGTGMDCDTFLHLPAVRNLLPPYETFLEINVSSTVVNATLGPGSPAQTILLPEGHLYQIQLNYDYAIPNGIDPDFAFSYEVLVGGVPTVPGLGMEAMIVVALLLVGLGTVLLRARRSSVP